MNCRLVKLCELQLRRSTALQWSADSATILGAGEPGFESDTFKLKIGDGITSWANLPYIGSFNLSTSPNSILWSSDGTSVTGSTGFSYTPGVSGNVKLEGDFLPSIDSVYSLGVTGQAWKDLHLAGNTIYLGKSKISADNDGVLIFTKADGTIDTRIGQSGPTGSTGKDGITGATGKDGITGATGKDGITGATGETGKDGKDGITGATGKDAGFTFTSPTGAIVWYDGSAVTGTTGLVYDGNSTITNQTSNNYINFDGMGGVVVGIGNSNQGRAIQLNANSSSININDQFVGETTISSEIVINTSNLKTNINNSLGSVGQVLTSDGTYTTWQNLPSIGGATGPTGPAGNTTAYIFDGGNSSSSYFLGPAFDCGSSI